MAEAIDYFLIQNLLNRYSEAVDQGDFDAVGAMFRHADVYFPGETEPSVKAGTGDFASQLHEWTRVYPETGNPCTRHLCTNPIIDFDDDTHARCRSYFVVFQAAEGFPLQPIITGNYVDRLEKVGEAWRFTERRELVGQTGDLSAHLLQSFDGPTGD
ncbi:MAG: nuclear transport factor 2 family protein [Deltaproteobacteria bacterium]|nr:nuclear transport factor 2 family protein [Deltaproteobacteria bacterium]MBW2362676.1 nuclear transport factor 2 family protein [Deltaproteobacteria bacterium]